MNILDKITKQKRILVDERMEKIPLDQLTQSPAFKLAVPSLKKYLIDGIHNGIISEFKRQSPSKGVINGNVIVEEVVKGYENAGVSGLSVLTDTEFFGGTTEDLIKARAVTTIPILRKDFMIDPYQVYEAKSMGASAILLIAACLTKQKAVDLATLSKDLGLDVLMEIHSKEEIEIVNEYVDIVGVNNRNLKTFEVSLQQSVDLANEIPERFVKISESGIYEPKDIAILREYGFKGFLIGENFMRTPNPGEACIQFSNILKNDF